jgi:hypothetical protein
MVLEDYVENEFFTESQYLTLRSRADDFKERGYGNDLFEYQVNPDISKLIISHIPEQLRNRVSCVSIQLIGTQKKIIPHIDHDRISSIMYPIVTASATTVWYEQTEDIEIIPTLKILDINKLSEYCKVELKADQWYIFDHQSCHSVENMDNSVPKRIALCIEFDDINPQDLFEIVEHAK